jgi:hypothetical protein
MRGTWCVAACLLAAGCKEAAGPTETDVRYLPSSSLQPGEFAQVSLGAAGAGLAWGVAEAPAGADYTLAPDGADALFRARTAGDYILHATPTDGAAGETRSAELHVAAPSCLGLTGTVIGITGGEANRFVHIDPCTGTQTVLADLDTPGLTGFPQGIYAVDAAARRLYVPRSQDLEPHLLAVNVDTGTLELDAPVPSPGLRIVAVDPGGAGLFGVTDGAEPRLVHIDETTGALTDAEAFDGAGVVQGVYAVDPAQHRLYFLRGGGDAGQNLVAIDTRSGAPVLDVRLAARDLLALQLDAEADRLFGVTGCCPNRFALVDRDTGGVTPLTFFGDSTVGFPQGINALASGEHRFLFQRSEAGVTSLIGVDTATGSQVSSAVLEGTGLLLVDYVPAP